MIQKKTGKPTIFSRFQTGVKIVIFAEILGFLGSYAVWVRMNRDQGNCEIHSYSMKY